MLNESEKDFYWNSSGMNSMFEIPYNFWLSVKFQLIWWIVRDKKLGSAVTTTLGQ